MLKRAPDDRKNSPQHSVMAPASDGWRPPGGYADANQWALENREALEHYAQRNERDGTAAEQLDRFLAAHPALLNGGHAEI